MAWFIDMPFTMFYIMHSLPTNQHKGFFTMISGMRGMRPKIQKHSAYYRRVGSSCLRGSFFRTVLRRAAGLRSPVNAAWPEGRTVASPKQL